MTQARGMYNKNSQIKFDNSMLKSSLRDYSDPYILVSGTITIDGAGLDDNAKRLGERNTGVIFKSYAPFTYQGNGCWTRLDFVFLNVRV